MGEWFPPADWVGVVNNLIMSFNLWLTNEEELGEDWFSCVPFESSVSSKSFLLPLSGWSGTEEDWMKVGLLLPRSETDDGFLCSGTGT